jgi:hypothetical protein
MNGSGHAVPTPRVLSVRRVLHDCWYSRRKAGASFFSSGPCAKPPGYSLDKLATESLGRSHRAKIGKARLQLAIDLMRDVLQLPDTHRIGIVPGSDTGAFEMAMWTMLGARGVTTLAWESFGEGWVTDAVKQLKLEPTVSAPITASFPISTRSISPTTCCSPGTAPPAACACPTANGSPTTRRPDFADATSAVFAYDIPWDKIDVATFSWQKVLGGEGAHGVLILGPRAVERLETYTPSWPPQGVPPGLQGQACRRHLQGRNHQHPRCWPSKTRSSRWNGPSRSAASKVSRRAPPPTPMRSTRSWPNVRGWATSRSTAASARRPRCA